MIIDKLTRAQFWCEVCCVFFCASESSTEKAFSMLFDFEEEKNIALCCVKWVLFVVIDMGLDREVVVVVGGVQPLCWE